MYDKNASTKLYNTLMGNPNTYNAVGRTSGRIAASGPSNDNFFTKRASSIGNAVGTTLSALTSLAHDVGENIATQKFLGDSKSRMNDVAKKYGYNDYHAVWDARDKAEAEGDQATLDFIDKTINPELQAQATANANEATAKAKGYEDYRKNNLISKNINQDPGKFAGSAINTVSTMADVLLPGAGVVFNSVQGGLEGVADELEQNGLENFDLERAAQNALTGAVTGGVVGAFNKGLSNSLAKKGGNLFKGGNAVTRGLNDLGSKTAGGRIASTIATGAGRGALSGAVGGATGAGLSAAMNNQDVLSNAVQGAVQGAKGGAMTGGIMAGANMALNKTPAMQKINQATEDWKNSGEKFKERLDNTINSGDSIVANKINDWRAMPANEFGPKYNQLSGTGEKAVDYLLNRGQGEVEAAVNSPAVESITGDGDVDLVYGKTGKNGYGLAHIEEKHGRDVARKIPSILENGNIVNDPKLTNNNRITMLSDDGTGAVRLDWDGTEKQWVVTAYEGLPNSPASNANNQIADGAVLRGSSVQDRNDATVNPSITQDSGNVNSQWDNLAQEAGYNNYDEVIRAYQQANPNANVNAGAVLTWLDSNPAEVTAPVQTSKQIKGQRKLVEEITNQFNAPDKPTVRATKPQETFKNLYENWGLSDGDDIRQAISYAEPGSLIPKMISEAAGEAGIIDLSDAQGMVLDLGLRRNSNYKKTVAVLSDIWDSMPNEDVVGGKSGVNALKFQRAVESAASDAMGTSGEYHIGNNIVDQTTAQNLMRIADNIGDKLDEAATARGAVQNVINRHASDIQQMRNAFPNNTKWQNMVDSEISGAHTIRDLRHSIRDLTRANIFITNGDENYNTVGGRMAARYNDVPTSKAGIRNKAVNAVWDKIADSKLAKNLRLKNYDKQMRGETPVTSGLATQPNEVSAPTPSVDNNYGPTTQLYNAIGRTEGLTNAEQARTANYLANAAQEAEVVPKAPNAGYGTLEELISPNTNSSTTSVYNSVYGTPTNSATAQTSNNYFQPTGDYWTDILAKAMSSAIDADDVTAFTSLYGMYQDALSNIQKQSTGTQKLSATQQRANAAMNSLERLSNMTPDLAYNLSSIPLIGGIATLGGNDYESEAKSLAQQIGYMVSGSNIKDSEAEAIGKSYVPQPWDNEQVRQSKLRRAYEIISQYQNAYSE